MMAASIMAGGLIRAARPTTTTLMPKNTVTTATPTSAPIRPLTPTRAALRATMIAAAAAVSAPARRTIVAYFASISWLLRVWTATLLTREMSPRTLQEPVAAPLSWCRHPVRFTKGITGLSLAEEGLLVKHITKSLTLSLPDRTQFMTIAWELGPCRPLGRRVPRSCLVRRSRCTGSKRAYFFTFHPAKKHRRGERGGRTGSPADRPRDAPTRAAASKEGKGKV